MIQRKIYVASSWRNEHYPDVVDKLRAAGHDVYDFRNPPSGDPGFKWENVDPRYTEWTPEKYRDHLDHPKAVRQFGNDIEAMEACDTCVLVLPCGRSATGRFQENAPNLLELVWTSERSMDKSEKQAQKLSKGIAKIAKILG